MTRTSMRRVLVALAGMTAGKLYVSGPSRIRALLIVSAASLAATFLTPLASVDRRDLDVADRGQFRQQMIALKDESEIFTP